MRRPALLAFLTAALAVVPAALAQTPQNTLTIYSSLPLQGELGPQSEDIVRGIRMALDDTGGKVGRWTIQHVSLDDATDGKWDPEKVSANARRAVSDRSTIGYIGEFSSGASAISIPILNVGEVAQVSPSNTYTGLTRREGAERGEPDKYYPSGKRTYARVIPADHLQAAAVAKYLQEVGVRRAVLVDDAEVYGDGLCDMVRPRMRARGIRLLSRMRYRGTRSSAAAVARRVPNRASNAMVFCGITQNGAAGLFRTVAARRSRVKMFGPDGVAQSAFAERIGRRAAARTYITLPTLDPTLYPEPAREFFQRFRQRFGKDPEPYSIYGYEAMALLLDAMRRAGNQADQRAAVVAQLFATRDRESIIGPYSIDSNGDTTLPYYGGLRVDRAGRLVFDRLLNSAR